MAAKKTNKAKLKKNIVPKAQQAQVAKAPGLIDNRSDEEKRADCEFQQIRRALDAGTNKKRFIGKKIDCKAVDWCLPDVACNARITMNEATRVAFHANEKICK